MIFVFKAPGADLNCTQAATGGVGFRYDDRFAGLCPEFSGSIRRVPFKPHGPGIVFLPAEPGKNPMGLEKQQIPALDFPFAGAFQCVKNACFQTRLKIRACHARCAHWAECQRRPVKFVAAEEIVAPRKTCRLLLCRVQQNMRLLVICHQRYRQTAHLRQIPLDAFNSCGFRTGGRYIFLCAGHQQHCDA